MIETDIQLRFNDMDMLGHLYNGQYQHLYDVAKSDFFDKIFGVSNQWSQTEEAFLTASTTNNYYSSVILSEPITIQTYISRIGTKSFVCYQRMINRDSQEIKSDSLTTMVLFNNKTKSTFEIPAKWETLLKEHLVDEEFIQQARPRK